MQMTGVLFCKILPIIIYTIIIFLWSVQVLAGECRSIMEPIIILQIIMQQAIAIMEFILFMEAETAKDHGGIELPKEIG